MTVYVFSGPTLPASRVRELAPDVVHRAPVCHGDLLALDAGAGDRVLIIDGLWHQTAPVRHKEILMLLDAGVTVVGAASMGALRAAELQPYGMLGTGKIWEAFYTGVLDADDEVAVLHTSEGQVLTEALVNLRAAIRGTSADGHLSRADSTTLEEIARRLPYTRRTWTSLHRAASAAGLTEQMQRVDLWRQTHPYDLKREDAEYALDWITSRSFAGYRPQTHAWRYLTWETSFVPLWRGLHSPAGQPPNTQIPFTALLQYQQLYDPGFGNRWRARVLSFISRLPCTEPSELEPAALKAAADQGVQAEALSSEQLAFWLTDEEAESLDSWESLLRIMVRSACWDSAWDIWPSTLNDAGSLLRNPEATSKAVAEALAMNASVEGANPKHSTSLLDPARLAAHLADRWNLPRSHDIAHRTAAARDRGFRDFAGAAEAARTFYLYERSRERQDDAARSTALSDGER